MNPEGRLLHDRYRVLSQIGSGGQGSVWLAEDTLLERRVALKELIPPGESIDLDESRARALIEARALARVRHRCIVRVHDIFFVGLDPWIVMEYIRGRSLADIVAADPLTEREIAAIGLSVLDGLQAVHAARVLHRDVKPKNILVDQEGAIFLVDFGIAKIAGDAAAAGRQRDISITGRGRVIGTPEYLAPEQIHGYPATPASDLWSVGVTLYYAMEGHTPFARASGQPTLDLRSAILYEDPPRPASQGPLATLVLRLLAKDPPRRPSLGEAYRVLEAIMTDGSQNGRPSGTDTQPAAFQEPSKNMVRTDHITEAMRPLDQAERARHGIADAVRDINPSGSDSGVARLLAKPDDEAARILNNCSPEVAAELVTGMAASRVSKAGNILQMLSVTRSGKVIDHMPPGASAAVIVALPERRQQVRVLSQADVRTVAEVLMELMEAQGEIAERLVATMPLRRAAAVLNEVKPLTAARILQGQSANLRAQLLQALSPEFRQIVVRSL